MGDMSSVKNPAAMGGLCVDLVRRRFWRVDMGVRGETSSPKNLSLSGRAGSSGSGGELQSSDFRGNQRQGRLLSRDEQSRSTPVMGIRLGSRCALGL